MLQPRAALPTQLLPADPEPKQDPDWSPDGDRIIFGSVPADTESALRVLDLNTHHVSELPGSRGLFSPRWSPDGRYIVAMPADSLSLVIFDFQTPEVVATREGESCIPKLVKGRTVCLLFTLAGPSRRAESQNE